MPRQAQKAPQKANLYIHIFFFVINRMAPFFFIGVNLKHNFFFHYLWTERCIKVRRSSDLWAVWPFFNTWREVTSLSRGGADCGG